MIEDKTVLTENEIISRLLGSEIPEKTVTVSRLGIPVKLKGLTGKEVYKLRERCTQRLKEKGREISRLDEEAFNVGLLALATVSPDWGNSALIQKFNASGKEEVIKRVLLAGELSALGDVVLDLSGFNEELDEVKN
jgi:Phage XkdN-like protein.